MGRPVLQYLDASDLGDKKPALIVLTEDLLVMESVYADIIKLFSCLWYY